MAKKKTLDGKDLLNKVLKDKGFETVRLGGLEYLVATNFLIFDELLKIKELLKGNPELSLLDVWYDAFNQKMWKADNIYKAFGGELS